MSSPEEQQDEEPMEVDGDGFDQELEAVDSPDENFETANTTEDEEDADEENRDPRSFLSAELRSHRNSQNNEDYEEEAILENYSPAEENQIESDGLDPLNEGGDGDHLGNESESTKETESEDLVNGEDKDGEYEGDEDEISKSDKDGDSDQEPEIGISTDDRPEDDEGDIDLTSDRKDDDDEQETEIDLNASDKEGDDDEEEAEIDLNASEKDEDDEEREKQSNPFADEDSTSADKEIGNKEKENLIDDENESEEISEKDDLFVAAEDNSNSNENEDSNQKDLFVSGEETNEDICDKDEDDDKKSEVEVLDIGDDSDEEEEKKKESDDETETTAKGTKEDPVELEADEVMSKSSDGNSPLLIDEDVTSPKSQEKKELKSDEENENEEEMPKIRISNLIFDQPAEEEEDDEDNVDIQSMMQVEMMEDEADAEEAPAYEGSEVKAPKKPSTISRPVVEESPARRILPRRAAARAAANTIKEISSHELEEDDGGTVKFGRRSSPDRDYNADEQPQSPRASHALNQSRSFSSTPANNSTAAADKHKCHICRRMTTCPIVVRQFGSDVHMCSNSCFNTFRNPDPSKRPLPCAHCGILHRDTDDTAVYYWETMNFCSDMCVAKYQIEVGGKCATCIKKVAWNCLGKYCVRFGSDIRQFCTATCLEAYKKNARVCFHCQLDIKRLGNVVLANIPAKASPKEFCSQDCVEMYIEQNLKQMVRPKPGQMASCVMCGCNKEVHKEMCTPNATFKICSDYCWRQLLTSKSIHKPAKCESCIKYINMELDNVPAAHYISTAAKIHGFCSATCKNVFVLKNRSILACTTCKVKKYNFDLIEYISSKAGAQGFAVCSLNCIPKGAQYIAKLKELYNSNTYTPSALSSVTASQLIRKTGATTVDSNTVPIISSVTSIPQDTPEADSAIQIQSVVTLADGDAAPAEGDPDTQVMYENYEDGESVQDEADGDEELVAELDEMRRLYEEVVEQLESISEKDFYPEQRTVSCWIRPDHNTKETQTDVSELEAMERIQMVPQEKTIYVPVPIPYPVLLPFPFYALETPVPYPFPVPLPFPVPIPVIFPGTPNTDTNSSKSNLESVVSSGLSGACEAMDSQESLSSQMDTETSLLPLNPSATFLSEFNKDESNSPAGTSRTKSKPQIMSDSGVKAWRSYFGQDSDPVLFRSAELGQKLSEFVNRVTRPTKEKYPADTLLYLTLGIQQYLRDNERTDYIFYDDDYSSFVQSFTHYAEEGIARDIVLNRIEESNFWETTELGAPSPGVLLFTVVYFNYKYFNLKTWEAHAALQFKDVVVVEREDMESGDKTKYLIVTTPDGVVTEVEEKTNLRERCPVRLFEFYQLKCSSNEGSFYKAGNKIYTPRNEWFSNEPLDQMAIYRMLVRAMMIKSENMSR